VQLTVQRSVNKCKTIVCVGTYGLLVSVGCLGGSQVRDDPLAERGPARCTVAAKGAL
jgi:hypothetical protein